MLKFTNTEKTAATFNGASFNLSLPENWDSIGDAPTRDAVLNWLAKGNTPEPLPSETPEQIIARLDAAIESHILEVVAGRGYVSIERLTSVYIDSPNSEWQSEARAAPKWVTAIWEKALIVQSDVQQGKRDIPTEAELIDELPKFTEFLQAA